jgi:hypothetical protein
MEGAGGVKGVRSTELITEDENTMRKLNRMMNAPLSDLGSGGLVVVDGDNTEDAGTVGPEVGIEEFRRTFIGIL